MSEKPKHTKGPWRVDGLTIEAADGNVALVNLARRNDSDARLIAAAPELLEACHEALSILEYERAGATPKPSKVRNTIAQVYASIAKAEGI